MRYGTTGQLPVSLYPRQVLEDAIAQAVKDPKFIEFMNKSYLGIDYRNAAGFKALVEADMKVLQPVVESINKK